MSNFMNDILSQMDKDVNEKTTTLFGVVQKALEQDANSVPRFLDDPSIQNIPIEPAQRVSYANELNEYAQISNAYNKLLERGELNKLTDSFRSSEAKATQSRTERSFTQTIASYSRYISLLASST